MKFLKKIDHVGMVVEDLQGAIADFSKRLGLECDEQMVLEDTGVQIAFYTFGEGRMELVRFQKPIDGIDPIVTSPRKGVHHIAFQVDDINKAIVEMTKRGMKLITGFPRMGADGLVAFFYPIEGWDLLIELCQPADPETKK
ncbi:MAG: VOC family protein [Desulfobacterales bacterium]